MVSEGFTPLNLIEIRLHWALLGLQSHNNCHTLIIIPIILTYNYVNILSSLHFFVHHCTFCASLHIRTSSGSLLGSEIEYRVAALVWRCLLGLACSGLACRVLWPHTKCTELPLPPFSRSRSSPCTICTHLQLVYGHFVYDTSSTDISSTYISSTMTSLAEIEDGVMKRILYQ